MKNFFFKIAILFSSTLIASEAENQNSSNESSSNESSQSQNSESDIDRVIEVITEAALNDRDYGKDISDR